MNFGYVLMSEHAALVMSCLMLAIALSALSVLMYRYKIKERIITFIGDRLL